MSASSRLLLLVATALPAIGSAAPKFTELTGFGRQGVSVAGLSRNGEFVVGAATSASGTEAFRWSASTGTVGLGTFSGGASTSYASDVSDDGSVVVGTSSTNTRDTAFRWTTATGMVGLGGISTFNPSSSARAVSGDGTVVSGDAIGETGSVGFRWTAAGMQDIGRLPTGPGTTFTSGMSSDGRVIVGDTKTNSGYQAFRWSQGGGMVSLGVLNTSDFGSSANDVSDDGSVIVGTSGNTPFLWRSGTMTALPKFPGLNAVPRAISGDGTVVVGRSEGYLFSRGYMWSEADGMQDLTLLLGGFGVLPAGWTVTETTDVTRLTGGDVMFTGFALDANSQRRAFVAAVPEPGTMAALSLGALALLRRRRNAR